MADNTSVDIIKNIRYEINENALFHFIGNADIEKFAKNHQDALVLKPVYSSSNGSIDPNKPNIYPIVAFNDDNKNDYTVDEVKTLLIHQLKRASFFFLQRNKKSPTYKYIAHPGNATNLNYFQDSKNAKKIIERQIINKNILHSKVEQNMIYITFAKFITNINIFKEEKTADNSVGCYDKVKYINYTVMDNVIGLLNATTTAKLKNFNGGVPNIANSVGNPDILSIMKTLYDSYDKQRSSGKTIFKDEEKIKQLIRATFDITDDSALKRQQDVSDFLSKIFKKSDSFGALFKLSETQITKCINVNEPFEETFYKPLGDNIIINNKLFNFDFATGTNKIFYDKAFRPIEPIITTEEDTQLKFYLIGIIYHLGPDFNSGHYKSYTKINDDWYENNDSKSKINTNIANKGFIIENGSHKEYPYMLFYSSTQSSTTEIPIGIENIGNTCYLASVLQVLFNIPDVKKILGGAINKNDEESVLNKKLEAKTLDEAIKKKKN